MKTLLFPTDFTDTSRNALSYALLMANKLGAAVKALHVVYETEPEVVTNGPARRKQARATSPEELWESFNACGDELQENLGIEVPIQYEILNGVPATEILSMSYRETPDMIVMGTRGHQSVDDPLLGGVTTRVIQGAKVPVLAVPGEASFREIKNIAYATDLEEENFDVVSQLFDFANLFGATITAIHVRSNTEYWGKRQRNTYDQYYNLEQVSSRLNLRIVNGDDTVESLHKFIAEEEVDMLAMLTRYPRIIHHFYAKSYTRNMALYTKIPLLAFHE